MTFFLAVLLQGSLPNGMEVVVSRVEGHPMAVVGLAFRAGVWGEPEGRNGVAHVLEHVFLHAPTNSFPAPFETLSKGGPLGNAFMDVNAETMWALTYYYALRPADKVDEALSVFAEKMDHARLTQEILDRERPRALEEVRHVERLSPAIRAQLEDFARNPKAGREADISALTLEHLEAFRAAHYRPDRAILVVYGDIDPAKTSAAIESRFGALKRPEAGGRSVEERDALRVAAEAWQSQLRKQGRAYVEIAPDGSLRAYAPSIEAPVLSDAEFGAARRSIAMPMRMRRLGGDPTRLEAGMARDLHGRRLIQAAIDRLVFEADGGQRFLDALEAMKPEAVRAAVAKHLKETP